MRLLPLLAVGLLSLSGWAYRYHSTTAPVIAAPAIDTTLLRTYRWRNIGPADRGGRSIAISGVRGQPNVGYFGATGGGLWKTTDGGEEWTPVTDGQITSASVGAVAVAETNPDIVWIGMGETCIRGNIMPGDGVYKSTDAGKTWRHMGFRQSDAIAKIRIHPKNPDIVFVASYGKYGADSEERGLFKSTDGGQTWRKVLYRDAKTGAVDISIDQTNPDVMYAALWESFRNEWNMSSGGPGSGLFKSTDGGETWREITRNTGLPAGVVGKIGVAVSPADPNRVYAIIENDNGGLFSSDDAGATWTLVNANRNIRQRAFYYTHVAADPKNKDLVYILNVSSYRSTDGGKTLANFAGGDVHDLWIDPDNTEHVLLANDRGGAITTNASNPQRTWTARDYPTSQLYRISATTHVPFHICSSQQDATSFCITTANPAAGGGRGGRGGGGGGGGGRGGAPATGAAAIPMNYNVGGSENGYVTQDPLDPDVFYVGTNANGGGFLNRVNRRTGEEREVNPYPRMFSGEESAVVKERWQWTYPIVFSRLDPRALYVGSQRVWKSTNAGQDWTAVSGNLTRSDPKTLGPSGGPITRDMNGPEIYGVVFTIAPSKRSAQVIWAGSDDGLIHVTQNGGTTWTNVTPKESPDFGRVSIIDASNFETGTAYAAVKRPLLNDRAPYIFRTSDYGKTWTKIVNGIRADDFVHAVREDPYKKGVLYAATHQGVYISFNDGDLWESLSLNMPVLPATDLVVMPDAIAISTMGRGFWILENINPLRNAVAASASRDAYLFTPTPAVRSSAPASIQYWLKRPVQSLKIEVSDSTGRLVRSFLGGTAAPAPDPNAAQGGRGGGRGGFGGNVAPPVSAGVHNITWDLRYPNAVGFPGMILWGGGLTGPSAPPGTYKVKITADGYTQTENLVVRRNPMFAATDADLRAQFALGMQIRDKVSEANNAVITIRDLKAQIADRLSKSSNAELKTAGEKLTADLFAVESEIYQVKNQAGQDPLNYPIKINNRLASLLTGVVNQGDGRPVGKVPEIFVDLKAELKVLTDRMDRVIATGVPSFNRAAQAAGVEVIVVKKPGPVM